MDNASSDDSVRVVQAHRDVEVRVSRANAGYARGMNEALGQTRAEILIALNPDTEAPPGSLEQLVQHLRDAPDVGLVAPALVGIDGRAQQSIYPYPGPVQALENGLVPAPLRRSGRVAPGKADRAGSRGAARLGRRWVIGAVHCVRAAALAGGQPYSTRWFMYAEDLELCWRLRRTGWGIVVRNDVTVVHHGSAAAGQRWGQGADLEMRSLPNIYDWLWTERSPRLGRATALVNAGGVLAKDAALRMGARLRPGSDGALRSARAEELGRLARYHGGVLRYGPAYRARDATERPPRMNAS